MKTEGGSFIDWRDAWRDMERTEEQIAAEDARRQAEAEAQHFIVRGNDGGGESRVKRFFRKCKTWGKCDENTVKMKARLAPLAGYFLRAMKNEFASPSWGIGARPEMSMKRLYEAATGGNGIFGAADAATRWRDFSRVREWVANTLKNFASWGFTAETAAIARKWTENPDADAPMIFPAGTRWHVQKMYLKKQYEAGYSQKDGEHFTDTHARESFYESKKHLNDTAPAEAGFSPVAHKPTGGLTPLVGACAFTDYEGDSDLFCSKGDAGLSTAAGRQEQPRAAAKSAENARVAKFSGKLPRRLWWLVWKWLPAFGRLHAGKNVAWSEAHFVAWFKSCLVAGKRCVDLLDLYEEKLMKWHGLASDWRVPGDRDLHPRGLFAELYRAAAALPRYAHTPSAN